MSVFKNLKDMHSKFRFNRNKTPSLLEHGHMKARIAFIQEEMDELILATKEKDLPEVIDALIDITVVAVGTLDLMGVNGQLHWNEVHRCNMAKEAGKQSKRPGMKFDLIKPEGWTGPEHQRILDGEY